MAVADCCRGTFTCFLVFINSIITLIALAIVGLAIYGLVVTGSVQAQYFLWSAFGAGIVVLLTGLMGCLGAQSNSKGWLCCYSFCLLVALAICVIYVSFAWIIVYALEGAVDCNFSPSSTQGTDCQDYEGAMNATALAFLAQGSECDLELTGTVADPSAVCENGDSWFESVVTSECPQYPSAGLSSVADYANCVILVGKQADAIDVDLGDAALAAAYFCLCPSRFAYAYDNVVRAALVPGMVVGGLVLLLIISACCLVCLPSQREVVMARYYQAA